MKILVNIKKNFIYAFIIFPRFIKYSLLSSSKNISGKAKFIQPCQLNGIGKIIFGNNVIIGWDPSPFLYSGYGYIDARNYNAKIVIEDDVMINNNVVLISDGAGITISKNTLIGTQCEIIDSDFHDLRIESRTTAQANTLPVFIGENVFIGSNVKIMKGVNIGKNSVIANGSIVTKSIPENVVAGGVPARVIKNLLDKEVQIK